MPGKEEIIIRNNLYNIAGLSINIVSNQSGIFRSLESFLVANSTEIDLEIVTKSSTKITIPEGKLLIDNEAKWVCIPGGYYNTSIYVCNQNTGEVLFRADANQDWSRAEVTYLDNNQIAEFGVAGFLCEILFRNRILYKQGLILHASALSWQGQGLVFTAPSGTGKSTQAQLWAKYMGALVLNDDRPALRLINKRTFVYGTPWSGKKTLYDNASAPLTAIVLLEQAVENQIIRLPVATSVAKIMSRCFLPYYDQEIMAMCLNNLGEMLSGTSVYLLKCRPDRESVELLHECLMQ